MVAALGARDPLFLRELDTLCRSIVFDTQSCWMTLYMIPNDRVQTKEKSTGCGSHRIVKLDRIL